MTGELWKDHGAIGAAGLLHGMEPLACGEQDSRFSSQDSEAGTIDTPLSQSLWASALGWWHLPTWEKKAMFQEAAVGSQA